MIPLLVVASVCNAFVAQAANFTVTSVNLNYGPSAGGQTITISGYGFDQPSQWQQVAAGGAHACALDSDGKAYCWGLNSSGQLGNGNTNSQTTPVAVNTSGVLNGVTLVQIVAGDSHTCALDDEGLAYCWGAGANGRLGNGATGNQTSPVAVNTSGVLLDVSLTQITAGEAHTCALDAEGLAYCWGTGANGRLGNSGTTNQNSPVAVTTSGVLLDVSLVYISAGGSHTCAVDDEGSAYCWGNGVNGRLGNNATSGNQTSPVAVNTAGVLAGKSLEKIAAGGSHTCAIDDQGAAYCWGAGANGRLGNGNVADQSTAVIVNVSGVLNGKFLEQITTGEAHTCALDSDGKTYCWGLNSSGQLGDGSNTDRNTPVAVYTQGNLTGRALEQVVAGSLHTCVVASSSEGFCWGAGANGRLGNNNSADQNAPVLIDTSSLSLPPAVPRVRLDDADCISVTVVSNTSITCITSPHVAGWVDVSVTINGETQVLINGFRYDSLDVTAISPDYGPDTGGTMVTITGTGFYMSGIYIADVATGTNHTLAIDDEGNLYAWGRNNQGQLGRNNTTNASVPVKISGGVISGSPLVAGVKIVQIAAGDEHSMAIDDQGNLYTWGNGAYGRLGRGNTTNSNVPVKISGGVVSGSSLTAGISLAQVAAGYLHSMAIDTQGNLHTWGRNNQGQLGRGNGTNSNVPVRISGGSISGSPLASGVIITRIAAGDTHSMAVDSQGNLYTWGDGGNGRLGRGNTTGSNMPVKISGGVIASSALVAGISISQISAGYQHSMAVDTLGNLYTWGRNNQGQLGYGNTTGSNVPVKISGGAINNSALVAGVSIVQIAAGYQDSFAIDSQGNLYAWGYGNVGRLGNGSTARQTYPVKISDGAISGSPLVAGTSIVKISAWEQSMAIDDQGNLYAWGRNNYGKLGINNTTNQTRPVKVIGGAFNIPPKPPTVMIGGAPCINVVVVSSTEITCTTTAHVAELTDVDVTIRGKKVSLPDAFTYVGLELTSLSMLSGSIINIDALLLVTSSEHEIVTVTTNNPNGYTLLLAMSSDDVADQPLKKDGTSNTFQIAPASFSNSALGVDEWGFSLSGLANSWSPVPILSSPVVINSTASAPSSMSADDTDLYFGTKAGATLPAGYYSATVTYIAVVN